MALLKSLGSAARPPLHHPEHRFRLQRTGRRIQGLRRAFDITNPGERQKYVEALFEKIGFQPNDQEFHCFAIEIKSAAANTLVGEEFQH